MWKRTSPLCSACIETKEMYGHGDGGHACECEFDLVPDPQPSRSIDVELGDTVTWKPELKPTNAPFDVGVVNAIIYADNAAYVEVYDEEQALVREEVVFAGALMRVLT